MEKPIAYGSLNLNCDQRKYCTIKKELVVFVRSPCMDRNYLLGR